MTGHPCTQAVARARFAQARVARLATVSSGGRPHVVPITFALLGDTLVTAVDHKPKRTQALRRLANLAANSAAAVLVDHYSDDWTQLWWARADGHGRVHAPGEAPDAIDALAERYAQYRERPPEGPVIVIEVQRWSAWAYSGLEKP